MTPSGPQPGDVDTAITHDSDQCWAHVELTNTGQPRGDQGSLTVIEMGDTGPAPDEGAGASTCLTPGVFLLTLLDIPARVELSGSHC